MLGLGQVLNLAGTTDTWLKQKKRVLTRIVLVKPETLPLDVKVPSLKAPSTTMATNFVL